MPNLFWPQAVRPHASPQGWVGRTVHWAGVTLAVLILLTALGFVVDGWEDGLAGWLALGAVALALLARGVRYLLARE